ncbi:MAG: hypothetical protein IPH06_09670 [Alphaproteobacteria bacterium]|nr:hypothetical protein [Alphaproteobacteria bacterium]QQS58261.1 MAG: hypothetical protein IPN28_05425 [Alphaproteobacteria bacterium]
MTRKKPSRRKRSAVAKDLYTPKYKQRVVELKTRYRRKKKKSDPGDED